jgi:hypothetical protein
MKPLVPTGLLLMGMFVAGCNTPENMFNAGDQPIGVQPVAPVKPAAPVVKVAPTKPATPVLVIPPQNQKPVETAPVVIVTNPPPDVAPANPIPAAPVVVPDDSTPAPTKPAEIPTAPPAATLPTIVTPDTSIAGKVVAYNAAARFAVLSFPAGPMPRQDQSVFVYRGGMKAGEIKITGPQRDNNTVGDVVNGDAQVGDDVRDQ